MQIGVMRMTAPNPKSPFLGVIAVVQIEISCPNADKRMGFCHLDGSGPVRKSFLHGKVRRRDQCFLVGECLHSGRDDADRNGQESNCRDQSHWSQADDRQTQAWTYEREDDDETSRHADKTTS